MRKRADGEGNALALIVADEVLGNLVALCLRHAGCRSEIATTVARARGRRTTALPALLVVDLSLGNGSAISLLPAPRGLQAPPSIALVRPRDPWSSLEAFQRGADQVITLPFTPDELAVRAFALLRRFKIATEMRHAEALEGLDLNIDETVRIGARTHRLSPGQNSLLYLLAANAGRLISRREIRQLAASLAQRGNTHGDQVQPEKQILAKGLALDGFRQRNAG